MDKTQRLIATVIIIVLTLVLSLVVNCMLDGIKAFLPKPWGDIIVLSILSVWTVAGVYYLIGNFDKKGGPHE